MVLFVGSSLTSFLMDSATLSQEQQVIVDAIHCVFDAKMNTLCDATRLRDLITSVFPSTARCEADKKSANTRLSNAIVEQLAYHNLQPTSILISKVNN